MSALQKTVGVERQIENERCRDDARGGAKGKGILGTCGRARADAEGVRGDAGCCFQIETSSALVRRQRRRLLPSSLPRSLSSLPSLLPSYLPSFPFSLTLSAQTTVLMGRMRLPSFSLHGIEGPWGEDGHPGEGGERMFSIRWVSWRVSTVFLSYVWVRGGGARGKARPLVVRVVWMGGEEGMHPRGRI
jgi:hypothetical protein